MLAVLLWSMVLVLVLLPFFVFACVVGLVVGRKKASRAFLSLYFAACVSLRYDGAVGSAAKPVVVSVSVMLVVLLVAGGQYAGFIPEAHISTSNTTNMTETLTTTGFAADPTAPSYRKLTQAAKYRLRNAREAFFRPTTKPTTQAKTKKGSKTKTKTIDHKRTASMGA
jgi:uncharacterized membrane protein YoaK (UPF0700 family)